MNTDRRLVDALTALCVREGGEKAVAAAIGSSAATIWQITNGTKLPSGKARGIGRDLAARLDRRFPGWMDLQRSHGGDEIRPLAQNLSQGKESDVFPLIRWEDIVTNKIPDMFRAVLPDEALGPTFPRGTEILWTTKRRVMPGRLVLVQDSHGQAHARMCRQGSTPGAWIAAALNPEYVTFENGVDGIQIVAVFKGRLEPDDE